MKHRKEKDYDEDDDDAEAFQYHAAVKQSSDEVQSSVFIAFFVVGPVFSLFGRLLFMCLTSNEWFGCIIGFYSSEGLWLVLNTQFGSSKDFLLELETIFDPLDYFWGWRSNFVL